MNVLLTGGSGGIGGAVLKALREKGHNVAVLDVKAPYGDARFAACDLTSDESVAAAAKALEGETFDAIVHAAGIYDLNSLVEIEERDFLKIFGVNFFGAYRVNRAFLPALKRGGGRIVMISSELAPLDPLPFTGLYGITKSAVEKYAFSLRMELQLLGISVSVVRPGAVDTGLLDVSTARLDDFTKNTKLYSYNADRFKKIVDGVEAKKIPPEKAAAKVIKALTAKKPKYVYKINRNPLLLILNALPDRMQTWIIKKVLTGKNK